MRNRVWLLFTVLVMCFSLPGCGGGDTPPPPPPVRITVSSTASTVPVGSTAFFFASVTGSSNHAVTWQVNGITGGDINTVGAISTGGLYTAPAAIPSPSTVTVTGVSQADSTKSDSAGIAITLAISPASATVRIQGGIQQFTAAGTSGGVSWDLTCVSPCDPSTIGTISLTGLYTAPDAIPDNVLTDISLNDSNLGLIASPIQVTAAPNAEPTNTSSASVYVNAGGPVVNQADQSAPVKLGTSGGNVNDITSFCCSGTLGGLVVRNGTNYVLSNNHVLARSGSGQNGEAISQPGLVDTNCNPAGTVANLSQQVPLNRNGISEADAAIAQIVSGQVDTTGGILQFGTVSNGFAQPAPPANTAATPAIGMPVAKSGRTSGLSCGTIAATDIEVTVIYSTSCGSSQEFSVDYNDQVDITSTSFGAPGDSGSLIVDATTAQPVALLYAGSPTDTIANPIQDVLDNLQDTADPPNLPTFVGGATHPVEACTGPPGPIAQEAVASRGPAQEEMERARAAKKQHVGALRSDPAVIGVGIGAGDTPGEASIVIFVNKEKEDQPIPATLNGIKTKVRLVKPFRAFGGPVCPAESDPVREPISLR